MSQGTGGPGPAHEDDIDRQLRELTAGMMAQPALKEPSAAERAKIARRDRKTRRRSARRGAARRQRRAGRSFRLKTWAIVVVVLAAAGGVAWLRLSQGTTARSAVQQAVQQQPTPGGTLAGGPPADPFAGTAAENWADGESGIVIPTAKPVGEFTAAQAAKAYQTTRRLLIAANLEQRTLLGGAPTAFAGLLARQQRADLLADLNKKGVNSGGYPLSTRKWVASFFPGSAAFIGNVIKVHGAMSAHTAHESGRTVLAIRVNYIFAYAVEPPGNPSDWMRVVDHQYGSFDFAQWDDPGGALEPWDQTLIGNAGGQCGVTDGYIHPDYPSERTPAPTQSGPVIDPYSLATSIPGGGAVCGRTSGT
jgi:hypothetical protein